MSTLPYPDPSGIAQAIVNIIAALPEQKIHELNVWAQNVAHSETADAIHIQAAMVALASLQVVNTSPLAA